MPRYSILLLTMTEYLECRDSIRWKQGNRFRVERCQAPSQRRRNGTGDERWSLEDVVVSVGEGDERLRKEQKGTAAKGSFIPIRKKRGGGEGQRRGEGGGGGGGGGGGKGREGTAEGRLGVNEWQAKWRRKGSNRLVGELYYTYVARTGRRQATARPE
jgi:hypothetical protein